MKISLKIFLGYFALVGLAAWFVLTIFVDEVKPGVRQAMEDTLVDTASVLAALAANDVKNGMIQNGNFAHSLVDYRTNAAKANIWGIKKQSADYRVYITDANGIVIFDSANLALGQDYSRWNDVYLTLQGQYGARSSPLVEGDKNGETVMYVAAPIKDGKRIIGALTVAKANRTLLPFIERAQSKIIRWGALLLTLSLIIGIMFTLRFTHKINALREYAMKVANGEKVHAPTSSNDELAELARAMQMMRNELDGKQYVQDSVQHLTHELKSPMTAIQGALELISPNMPATDQARFLENIKAQSSRVQTIIQNMLGLASLEHLQQLQHVAQVSLHNLIQMQIQHLNQKAHALEVNIHKPSGHDMQIRCDAFLMGQAIYNLLENALDFSPPNSIIEVETVQQDGGGVITIRDQGAGIPDYALDKIFDKFYSLPRANGQKSTGLGLNFVQEVVKLHGGRISIKNHPKGGVVSSITLPV